MKIKIHLHRPLAVLFSFLLCAAILPSCSVINKQKHKTESNELLIDKSKVVDSTVFKTSDNSIKTITETEVGDTAIGGSKIKESFGIEDLKDGPMIFENEDQEIIIDTKDGKINMTAIRKPVKLNVNKTKTTTEKKDVQTSFRQDHAEKKDVKSKVKQTAVDKGVTVKPTLLTQLWWLWILIIIALILYTGYRYSLPGKILKICKKIIGR